MDNSSAVPRLEIPAYGWWNEALHGVARAGTATVFPQAIGMAATWDVPEHFKTFEMISDEARAKYNRSFDEGLKTGRYEGLTFWTPNINIFVTQDGEEARKPMVKTLILPPFWALLQ